MLGPNLSLLERFAFFQCFLTEMLAITSHGLKKANIQQSCSLGSVGNATHPDMQPETYQSFQDASLFPSTQLIFESCWFHFLNISYISLLFSVFCPNSGSPHCLVDIF